MSFMQSVVVNNNFGANFLSDNKSQNTTHSSNNGNSTDNTTTSNNNNHLSNTTERLPGAVALIASYDFRIINIVVGVVGFLLNIFVILMLLFGGKRGKSNVGNQHSSSNFHVCCQSFVDATVAMILLTTTLFEDDGGSHYDPRNIGHQILCRVWLSKCLLWTGYTCSTYCVLSLNFERYIAIVYPIFHKNKFSKNRNYSICSLSIALTIAAGFNISYIIASSGILPDGRCTTYSVFPNEFTKKFVGFLTFFFLFFIPLSVITVLYSRMILVLHKRVAPQQEIKNLDNEIETTGNVDGENNTAYVDGKSDNLQDDNTYLSTISANIAESTITPSSASKSKDKHKEPKKKSKKGRDKKQKSSMEKARDSVFKTSALLSFSFVACWSWNQIYYFMFQLGVPGCDLAGPFYDFTVFMIFVNCIAYPIIFLCKYDPVLKNVKHLFVQIKTRFVKNG